MLNGSLRQPQLLVSYDNIFWNVALSSQVWIPVIFLIRNKKKGEVRPKCLWNSPPGVFQLIAKAISWNGSFDKPSKFTDKLFSLRAICYLAAQINDLMKKNIFVVDDDKLFSTMLADHLEDQGYDVKTFATGEACLEHLNEKPDVIILDYYLDSEVAGAKNGLEIVKIIHKTAPDQQVIMLSAQEHYGIALQTIASGAVQYVIKDDQSAKEIDFLLKEL